MLYAWPYGLASIFERLLNINTRKKAMASVSLPLALFSLLSLCFSLYRFLRLFVRSVLLFVKCESSSVSRFVVCYTRAPARLHFIVSFWFVKKFIKIIQFDIWPNKWERHFKIHNENRVQYEIKNKQEHEQLSDEFECSSRRRTQRESERHMSRANTNQTKQNENEERKKNEMKRKHTINANHLFAIHIRQIIS